MKHHALRDEGASAALRRVVGDFSTRRQRQLRTADCHVCRHQQAAPIPLCCVVCHHRPPQHLQHAAANNAAPTRPRDCSVTVESMMVKLPCSITDKPPPERRALLLVIRLLLTVALAQPMTAMAPAQQSKTCYNRLRNSCRNEATERLHGDVQQWSK